MILAAPLLLVVGGTLAYSKLTEHTPIVAVPDVVDRDVFAAIGTLKDAGFDVSATAADSPRPGGTILAQHPSNGHQLEEGSTVTITVARTRATVPDVTTMNIDDAKVALAKRGLLNVAITPDYRGDVDPGTVMSTTPAAYLQATKRDPIEVVVAMDPHVTMPTVEGLDQATATTDLQNLGLHVAVKSLTNRNVPAGVVLGRASTPAAGPCAATRSR